MCCIKTKNIREKIWIRFTSSYYVQTLCSFSFPKCQQQFGSSLWNCQNSKYKFKICSWYSCQRLKKNDQKLIYKLAERPEDFSSGVKLYAFLLPWWNHHKLSIKMWAFSFKSFHIAYFASQLKNSFHNLGKVWFWKWSQDQILREEYFGSKEAFRLNHMYTLY